MKLDESIINQFNLNPNESREPVNTMKVADLLDFIKESSVRIVNKSELYIKTEYSSTEIDLADAKLRVGSIGCLCTFKATM